MDVDDSTIRLMRRSMRAMSAVFIIAALASKLAESRLGVVTFAPCAMACLGWLVVDAALADWEASMIRRASEDREPRP